MNTVQVTFFAVLMMLAYAAPGFILVKMKKLSESNLPPLVTVLLYVCQPALTIVSFGQATALVAAGTITKGEMAARAGIAAGVSALLMSIMLSAMYFCLRQKQQEVAYRIFTLAAVFGNCGFFGVPILNAILPDHPEAATYSAVYSLVMNALCWTVGSAIITRDKKYISWQKAVANPNTLSAIIAIALFVLNIPLTGVPGDMLNIISKFSSPLCMIILGMRLATVKAKDLLCVGRQYAVILLKNIAYPLLAFAVMLVLPIHGSIRQAILILCACPVANVVLSFAEMLKQGQKDAANVMLLSTLASILTLPLICLLLPLLA